MTTSGASVGAIGAREELGRRVYSSSHRRRAANTGVPIEVFLEKTGVKEISVDRLSISQSLNRVIEIAEFEGGKRNPPRNFYGWAVVTAEKALLRGYHVVGTPQPQNPFHADIVFPDAAIESADAQRQYAAALAAMSNWKASKKSE